MLFVSGGKAAKACMLNLKSNAKREEKMASELERTAKFIEFAFKGNYIMQ